MRVLLSVAAAIVLLTGVSLAQGPAVQKRILMLSEYRPDSRINVNREEIFRAVFAEAFGNVDYYAEYMDTPAFRDADYMRALHEFLRIKYAGKRFDAIIAIGADALELVRANDAELFDGAPVIAAGMDREVIERQADVPVTGVVRKLDPRGTIDFILELQPQTKQIVVVAGGSDADYLKNLTQQQLRVYPRAVTFDYLINLPMDVLLARAAKLPPQSAIMYLTIYTDTAGRRFLPIEALEKIVEVANAPVYGVLADHLDHGIVGGNLHDTDTLAREVADLTVQQIRLEGSRIVPIRDSRATIPMANWLELRRWGLSEARLPAGTALRYKEPTVWQRYRWYITGAISLTSFQAAMIVALLAQRAKRQKAEEASRKNEAALRMTYERIRQLAGRLINAKEAVSARIARDLHDDVCQQLAVVSLSVSDFKCWRGGIQDMPAQEALSILQRRVLGLIEVVRLLSHDLHPTTLRHLGLVAAVEAHCIEIERRYDVQVGFHTDGDLQHIGWEKTLCLFRIAQEALRNAATHGNARRVTVFVRRSPDSIELTVADDGKGFDLTYERQHGSGLGLVSMEERVHLVDGDVDITTRPGNGTTVQVRVPMQSDAATQPRAAEDPAFMNVVATQSAQSFGDRL